MDLFPDPDMVKDLSEEELGFAILHLTRQHVQNGMVHPQYLNDHGVDSDAVHRGAGYPQNRRAEMRQAINEGWAWLENQGFLIRAEGTNGQNGWRQLGRKANEIRCRDDFTSYLAAAAFPKAMLHPTIADKVWADLCRGELDDAVFAAFKAVEVAVRKAGGFAAADIGTALMRKAFDKSVGPLSDMTQPESEREALAHLFAGAIGSYKNPHSHRTVTINDPREAQQMVVLASHLLSIADARAKK